MTLRVGYVCWLTTPYNRVKFQGNRIMYDKMDLIEIGNFSELTVIQVFVEVLLHFLNKSKTVVSKWMKMMLG